MTNAAGKFNKRNLASTRTAPALIIPGGSQSPPRVRETPRPLSLNGFLRKSQQDASIDWTSNKNLVAHARVALNLIRFDKTQFAIASRTLLHVVQSYHPATFEKAKELTDIIADWWLRNHMADAIAMTAATGINHDFAVPVPSKLDWSKNHARDSFDITNTTQFKSVEETREAVRGELGAIRQAGIDEDGNTADGKALIVAAR